MATPCRSRRGIRARDGSAVALAGLRQPVATSARTANPTIQPAVVVTLVRLTQESIVPPVPAPARTPSRAQRRWAYPVAALGFLLVAAVLAMSVLPSKAFVDRSPRCTARAEDGACSAYGPDEGIQFAITPADAQPVEPRLTITGVPTYDDPGDIYFVSVRTPELSLLDWLSTRSNPAADQGSYNDFFATVSPSESVVRGRHAMMTAKQAAEYVALRLAGYPAELTEGDIIVDQIVCLTYNESGTACTSRAPAGEVLRPGDQIVAVDGQEVSRVEELTPILANHQAGDVLDVDVVRSGRRSTEKVTTVAAPGEDARVIIGFMPMDTTTAKLPEDVSIDIDTNLIGGPSAGLAFTLTVLDSLTEGSLLGGNRVAVTGTIAVDGSVGAIGGLPSKAAAVWQQGVRYFIIPASQGYSEVMQATRASHGEVQFIQVSNITEALQVLEALGGDPLKPVSATGGTDDTDATPDAGGLRSDIR